MNIIPIFTIVILKVDDLVDVDDDESGGVGRGGAGRNANGESVNMLAAVGALHSFGPVRIFATFLKSDPSCRQRSKFSSSAK